MTNLSSWFSFSLISSLMFVQGHEEEFMQTLSLYNFIYF
jgi:hypothetical protein